MSLRCLFGHLDVYICEQTSVLWNVIHVYNRAHVYLEYTCTCRTHGTCRTGRPTVKIVSSIYFMLREYSNSIITSRWFLQCNIPATAVTAVVIIRNNNRICVNTMNRLLHGKYIMLDSEHRSCACCSYPHIKRPGTRTHRRLLKTFLRHDSHVTTLT